MELSTQGIPGAINQNKKYRTKHDHPGTTFLKYILITHQKYPNSETRNIGTRVHS